MICLKRNKQKMYLCKQIENSLMFEKPKEYRLNYQPISTECEMLTIGQDYSMYLKISCTPKEAINFSNGDMCYIYKKPFQKKESMCDDADYIVDGNPLITINSAEIRLRKLSGE